VFLPWIDRFSRLIVRISGSGSESAVSRLEPAVADAGAAVAFEAAWRAILEIARGAVDSVSRRLAGAAVAYEPPREAVQQTVHFLESLSLETTDLGTIGPRMVRLAHALDHLRRLHDDLPRTPPPAGGFQPPAAFAEAARALAAWHAAAAAPETPPGAEVLAALEASAQRLGAGCKAAREKLLEDVALRRTPAATARGGLETLAWADGVVHDAWRLADSLRVAADG
jgi:phosphate:Na+ symporter